MVACSGNPARKTQYDLISVYHETLGWVNVDSLAPNLVIREWLSMGNADSFQAEVPFHQSRIDFRFTKRNVSYLMEIKGCTLIRDEIGYFPDAPSLRGTRHVRELISAKREGFIPVIGFVIPVNGISEVRPNTEKDPAFAQAFTEALHCGVRIWYFSCDVTADSLSVREVFSLDGSRP